MMKTTSPKKKTLTPIIDSFLEETTFDYDVEKAKFIANMDMLKSMSVEESTFYKKWMEVREYRDMMPKSEEVKAKIWRPTDINDKEKTVAEIQAMKPRIFYVDPKNKEHMEDWLMLRFVLSHNGI
jgi:hypothetical protein